MSSRKLVGLHFMGDELSIRSFTDEITRVQQNLLALRCVDVDDRARQTTPRHWRAAQFVKEKRKLAAYAMERVAVPLHVATLWLFEPAKRPDDRADYCLGCGLLH